jgi:hypothetical protein
VEELETELAYSIHNREENLPDGAVKGVPVGHAFDNYDELTQLTHTLSGAETLHDTMGILYQEIPAFDKGEPPQPVVEEDTRPGRKRAQRKLQVDYGDIEPYHKKPKMSEFTYESTDIRNLPNFAAVGKN